MNTRSNILRLAIFALLLAPLVAASPALAADFIQAAAFFGPDSQMSRPKPSKAVGLEWTRFTRGEPLREYSSSPMMSPVHSSRSI